MGKMVTRILNFAFGFIFDKVRAFGAERLRGVDEQLADLITGLRKDLAASLSFMRQGVKRLQMSIGEPTESGNPSTTELPKNGKRSQDSADAGATTSAQAMTDQKSVAVEDALGVANAIRELKIKSEILELAKESFKEAGKKASEVFHDTALNTEERVLASKVRIASGILEHLERPEVAANDCLGYLKELHDMPDIQKIFSGQVKGKMRWLFGKKDSEAEIVDTVTMINFMLADFISKFTERRMAVSDWPMIKCGKRVVHPICDDKKNVEKMKEMGITAPWDMVNQRESVEMFRPFATNWSLPSKL